MRWSADGRGLLHELVIALAVLMLAVWASAALLARFFLGTPHLGPIPILPVVFSPFEAFAFPILGIVMGFSLAQGSAAHRRSAAYGLGLLYDRLARDAVEQYACKVPPGAIAFLNRVAEYIDANQRAQTRSTEARQIIVQIASELRDLASQLGPDAPAMAEKYADLARSIAGLVQTRRLIVELERETGAEQPLQPGEECVLRFVFEPEQESASLPADFGGRTELSLTLFLFGKGLALTDAALPLTLPLIGKSTVAATTARVLAGTAREEAKLGASHQLRIVVATTDGLEILQTYLTSLDVAPASLAAA